MKQIPYIFNIVAVLFFFSRSAPTQLPFNVTQHYHTSKIDHFTTGPYAANNLPNNNTYQQRYFQVNDYWDSEKGPAFLYLCGEYTCSFPVTRLFPLQITSQHAGRFLVLEHRYYGKSQPFETWQLDNLDYLQINQALADIAHFIQAQNEQYGERKWIVIGGSYPGALSAWFRYKYPHLTVGGWSSSGVVQAIESFDKFDEQVSISILKSGQACYKPVVNWTDYLQNSLVQDGEEAQKIRAVFGLAKNDNISEFMWFVSDIFTESVQYGARQTLCEFFMNNKTSSTLQGLKYWSDSRNVYWKDYTSRASQNTTIDFQKNMRQWYFQMCTQVGFFQIPSEKYPARSALLNITFWHQYCENMFGQKVWPDVIRTNTELGADKLGVTNLVMVNGAEDPWKWASKLPFDGKGDWHEMQTEGLQSFQLMEAQCNNCAHCADLNTPDDERDADQLKRVRQRIIELVSYWLGDSETYVD